MRRLSLRSLLGLTLVVVNVGLTAVVAIFAYRAAHDTMVEQALHSVAQVAQSRDREFRTLLERRQQRIEGFLASLQSLCAERNPSGSLGYEDLCLRTAVGGLHRSERAVTTEVRYRDKRRVLFGERPVIQPPFPGQLAQIDARAGRGGYAMRAARGFTTVDIHFGLEDINTIFEDRSGLEAHGEAFLTDSLGYRLTEASYPAPTDFPVRIPL